MPITGLNSLSHDGITREWQKGTDISNSSFQTALFRRRSANSLRPNKRATADSYTSIEMSKRKHLCKLSVVCFRMSTLRQPHSTVLASSPSAVVSERKRKHPRPPTVSSQALTLTTFAPTTFAPGPRPVAGAQSAPALGAAAGSSQPAPRQVGPSRDTYVRSHAAILALDCFFHDVNLYFQRILR